MSGEQETGSLDWQARQRLSDADMVDFLALWRVCAHPDSRVKQSGDQYVENEHPVLPFLADGLTALFEVGHLTLGEPDPASCAMRPLMVTASGRARYEHLCDRQGVPPYPTARIMGKTPNQ